MASAARAGSRTGRDASISDSEVSPLPRALGRKREKSPPSAERGEAPPSSPEEGVLDTRLGSRRVILHCSL